MIELLIVVALIVIASTVTALALRDPSVTRLERLRSFFSMLPSLGVTYASSFLM